MKNDNKLAQCLVAKKPRITTLAGPQLFVAKKKSEAKAPGQRSSAATYQFKPTVCKAIVWHFYHI
eukprot:10853097-Ditylum_brightwellii.AAC.1